MIVAWYQIRAVGHTFQDFPPEVLQELLSHFGTVWPRIVMLMQKTHLVSSPGNFYFTAGITPSGVTHYAPALIVVPCYMRSPNSTPIRAQNMVPITLPAEFTTQHCDPECYHSVLARFITRVWWWNSMSFSEEFTTTNGILLQEWEGACGNLWAHAFWNPNPWIILTNILHDRRALCCSSPTVKFLFLRTALSTRVGHCRSAASLTIVQFVHTILPHSPDSNTSFL